tara:strand:- start:741 stop:950 length:210 start_codon:yes stop_codon:yes gene_type:complete
MDQTHMNKDKKILEKFKKVNAITFTTYNNELVISFDGFEQEEDMREFADFVFAKIKMNYFNSPNLPTFH